MFQFLLDRVRRRHSPSLITMSSTRSPPPDLIVDFPETEDDLDLNNNPVEVEIGTREKGGSLFPEEFRTTRRKSSASRYGFDDAFVELVARQCQLVLETEDVLGRGSFGTVVGANYQGVPVAAKIVDTKGKRTAESVHNEEHVLDLPPHPHVVNILDIFRLGLTTAIIILPRLRKGNLLVLLNNHPPFPLSRILTFAIQIASAVTFCHAQGILHLDIKPQNVLIDFQNNLRLSDFGNSRKIKELESMSPFQLDGSVAYKAPELFCGHIPSTKADVYSYGISLWEILERETPYYGENEHTVIYKVVAQSLRPSTKNESGVPPGDINALGRLHSLYKCCWMQDAAQRPEMDSVLIQLGSMQMELK